MFDHLPGVDSFSIQKSLSAKKQTDDQPTNKAPQSSVTFIYEAKIAELCRSITVTWIKNLINHSLTISVENPSDEAHNYTFKIDLKAWQFWGKKGLKSFEVDGTRVDVYWDFRRAKFSSNPEPSDYYIALVDNEEVALVLGDLKKDAYTRTKKRPSSTEPVLLCKKENVYGKKVFCTKAMLHNGEKEHDISIEISSSSGLGDPEMWISIDGFEVIRVTNLHWRFRGNENVTMNNKLVDISWDVHDWLYGGSGGGHGLFILKPGVSERSPESLPGGGCDSGRGGGRYDSLPEMPSNTPEFFHIIYAWKFE